MGQTLPMRSAPVAYHVGNGLKADVTRKGRNGKKVTRPHASLDETQAHLTGKKVPSAIGAPIAR